MDMLALMHEGTPYGHLTVGGEAVTDLQLARMVGETPARVRKLLKELEAHGVFSRTDSGVMFSRRMVRDEHIRNVRAEAGKLGGNPNLVGEGKDNSKDNRLDKQTVKQNPTPSSSSSSASSQKPTTARVRSRLLEADWTAFDELLSRVPDPETWSSEIDAMLVGMAGHHKAAPSQIGRAIRDLVANGKHQNPNIRQLRRYVEGAVAEGQGPALPQSVRARAERLYTELPRYGFTQNRPIDEHLSKARELADRNVISDLPQFTKELEALLPLTWLRDAKEFDREKSVTRIAKVITQLQKPTAA